MTQVLFLIIFFIEFVKVCIPCKSILVREDDKPWYDSEIRRNTRKREWQKKKAVKTGNITDWIKYINVFITKLTIKENLPKNLFITT